MEELHKKERHCKTKSHTSLPPELKLSQMAKRKKEKQKEAIHQTQDFHNNLYAAEQLKSNYKDNILLQ
jgi:hypothetical protein